MVGYSRVCVAHRILEIEWGYVSPVGCMTVITRGSALAEVSGRLGVGAWSRFSSTNQRPEARAPHTHAAPFEPAAVPNRPLQRASTTPSCARALLEYPEHLLLEAIAHQPANFRSPALAEFADGRLPSARRRNPLHDATSHHLWLSEGPAGITVQPA